MLEMETVLNFCDIALTLFEQKKLTRIIQELSEKKKKINEIYLGSYFCEKYFLFLNKSLLQEIKDICNNNSLKLSLVIPMSSEKDLQAIKDHIDYIVGFFSPKISTIVINDFGMLAYIANKYSFPITIGRLLFKQSRDSRYDSFRDEMPQCNICSSYLFELIKDYPIRAIELDDVRSGTILINKYGYDIYVHVPLVYLSTGMVCEYSSAGLPDTQKFRPNNACSHQCTKYCTEYYGVNKKPFYKIGRTIYYLGDPRALEAKGISKEIYMPIDSLRECYENSSSIEQ